MFELDKQEVKLLGVDPIKTDDKEKATGLAKAIFSFEMVENNDYLSEIGSQLKSAIYQKDEDNPDLIDKTRLTKLRNPMVTNAMTFTKDLAIHGGDVFIYYGLGDPIQLQNPTSYGLSALPHEGGTCTYKFKVKGELKGKELGAICESLITQNVKLSIVKPVSPQQEMEV